MKNFVIGLNEITPGFLSFGMKCLQMFVDLVEAASKLIALTKFCSYLA